VSPWGTSPNYISDVLSPKIEEVFAEGPIRIKGDNKPPKLLKEVEPVYPEAAIKSGIEGVVILGAKTDKDGNVVDAKILRSVPALDQAAIAAVRQWKYEPMIINGKPTPVVFTVTVSFQLR